MKKVIFIFTILCALILSSCSMFEKNDAISLAKSYDEKDYAVGIVVDDEEIKDMADEFEVRSKGILCMVVVCPRDTDGYEDYTKSGFYIYCDDEETAESLVEDLEEYIDNNEDFKEEISREMVDRKKKIVYIGSEDTWEDNQDTQ